MFCSLANRNLNVHLNTEFKTRPKLVYALSELAKVFAREQKVIG